MIARPGRSAWVRGDVAVGIVGSRNRAGRIAGYWGRSGGRKVGVVGLALFTGEMVLLPTARLVLADGAGRMEERCSA